MKSMTGYGQAKAISGGRNIQVEIRAVNQRFLDVRLNLPREYYAWEREFRGQVQAEVERGKVDVMISRSSGVEGEWEVEANLPLARAYAKAWRLLAKDLKIPGELDFGLLQSRAELVRVVEHRGLSQDEADVAKVTLAKALRDFVRDREREGKTLGRDMRFRHKSLDASRKKIQARVKKLKPEFARRIQQRASNLLEGVTISEERLLQEVAMLSEKSDVTEELVRLSSHLKALGGLLKGSSAVGKKIDFLLQEVLREFNTIASKSADLDVTNCTLDARGHIEKLREQVQNIE